MSKLRNILNDKDNQLEDDKKSLHERLNQEKQDKIKAENEINILTSTLKIVNEKEIHLEEELRETREKVAELQELKQQTFTNLQETQKKFDESKNQVDRSEALKVSLTENIKQLEVENQTLTAEANQIESKNKHLETNLLNVKYELDSQKIKITSLQNENRDFDEQIGYWQSRYDDLQGMHSKKRV